MDSKSTEYCDWKGWDERAFGLVDQAGSAYFAEELRLSGFESVAGLNLCEIGFGNGSFASWATGAGANYLGTEAIPGLVVKGRSAGFRVFDASIPLSSIAEIGSLHLVVAFDVFEHLEVAQLKEVLERTRDLLREGGRVLARVPSGDSPFSRSIQHGDLTHRTVLGSSAVRQLALESGLDVVSIRQPAFPMRGLGPRVFIRRLLVVAARSVIYPIVTHALMGGDDPVLTPNLVFVLKRS